MDLQLSDSTRRKQSFVRCVEINDSVDQPSVAHSCPPQALVSNLPRMSASAVAGSVWARDSDEIYLRPKLGFEETIAFRHWLLKARIWPKIRFIGMALRDGSGFSDASLPQPIAVVPHGGAGSSPRREEVVGEVLGPGGVALAAQIPNRRRRSHGTRACRQRGAP